jgi:type I restriction enzyme, S subunit
MKIKAYPEYVEACLTVVTHRPVHWCEKRLRFSMVLNPSKRELRTVDRGTLVSFLPMENVSEHGVLDLSEIKCLEDVVSGFTYCADGDVLVAKITPCFENGKGALCQGLRNGIGFGSTEFHVCRPRHNELDANFLFYLSRSSGFRKFGEMEMKGTAGQKRVTDDYLRNFRVALPPPDEQRMIADFLDRETEKIDGLIAEKEKLIRLLEEKRKAVISDAVTKGLNPDVKLRDSGVPWLGMIPEHWRSLRIRRICQVKRGASPRPIQDPKFFDDDGEYAWVRIGDVTASNKYLETTTQRLSELGKSRSVPLSPGSLFLSIAGSVGKPIITKIKCCIHDGFVYFVGLKQNHEFLYYIFCTGELYKGLGKLGTQLNLNTNTIGDIVVPLPSLDEQESIVAFLDRKISKLDGTVDGIRQCISLLQERRAALLSAAVTGRIDVTAGGVSERASG